MLLQSCWSFLNKDTPGSFVTPNTIPHCFLTLSSETCNLKHRVRMDVKSHWLRSDWLLDQIEMSQQELNQWKLFIFRLLPFNVMIWEVNSILNIHDLHAQYRTASSTKSSIYLQAPTLTEVFDAVVSKQIDLIPVLMLNFWRASITQLASPNPDPSWVFWIDTIFSSLLASIDLTITAILLYLSYFELDLCKFW